MQRVRHSCRRYGKNVADPNLPFSPSSRSQRPPHLFPVDGAPITVVAIFRRRRHELPRRFKRVRAAVPWLL